LFNKFAAKEQQNSGFVLSESSFILSESVKIRFVIAGLTRNLMIIT